METRYQVICRPRNSADAWESMGTTFDNRHDAIFAAAEYDERWSDREHAVLKVLAEEFATRELGNLVTGPDDRWSTHPFLGREG